MSVILETYNLKKYYPIRGGVFKRRTGDVKAVDDVNLSLHKGECFGLVGESGCGKTTFGKTIIRLLKPTAGHIYFDIPKDARQMVRELENSKKSSPELKRLQNEYDLSKYKRKKLKHLRKKMQIVYQDPSTSLDPRTLARDIVVEPMKAQGLVKRHETNEKALEMFHKVGLSERHLYRYPHEFSGGQRQRIAVARALSVTPEFIVLDEPTSSVDVSVRSRLLDLFQKLQKDLNLTYLFISHDLSVVECISSKIAVMYVGKIVELAETNDLFYNQLHPYTKALISSIPVPDPTAKKDRIILKGDVPSPANPPRGCRFHPRCPKAQPICSKQEPSLMEIKKGHFVACHFPESITP